MTTIAGTTGFDRKFVVAAALIGVVYAAVVVTFGAMIGREAAGAAGVALTALAAAIFRQFETLRFRAMSDDEGTEIPVPTISAWRLVVFTGFFVGLKFVFGALAGVIISTLNMLPDVSDLASLFELIADDWRALAVVVFGNFIVYTFGGIVIAKGFRIATYSTLLISAFLSCFLDALLPLIPFMLHDFAFFLQILSSGAIWPAAFWLLFLAGTLLGAKYAVRPSLQPVS